MPMPAAIIDAHDLTRTYRMGETAVAGIRGVTLSVASGEMVLLKGDSGSGKTTLLSLVAGLDRPTAGRLRVAGVDLLRAPEEELVRFRRSTIGIVFQAFNLLPTLTLLENVCLPALLAGASLPDVQARADRLLSWLELTGRRQHRPGRLSGGEMQRTAIARALINDPAIILADEPTGNLDRRTGDIVLALLADLNRRQGRTVLCATHSDRADAFATVHLRLADGRLEVP